MFMDLRIARMLNYTTEIEDSSIGCANCQSRGPAIGFLQDDSFGIEKFSHPSVLANFRVYIMVNGVSSC
jgi:hypothetical protein